ncbi:MAG: carbohydrate ABC transporter permease [Chthonomonadales bacterium]|nr:carbohydrate ABC transporter permease [Chthonomonadales bacterium]
MMRRLLANMAMTAFALTVILPLVWVLITSLKSSAQIFASPWTLPDPPIWSNYAHAWQEAGIARCFGNSLLVTLATLAILLPVGAMAAYVFARYPFRGSRILFALFLGGMMFPLFLTIVPLFFLLGALGLLDSLEGLTLVYVAYSLPFTVFVLTGFFLTQPQELLEAAMIDGCGNAQAFRRVMLPLARPGLVVVGIFNAIGLWNEYPLALVIMSSDERRTLPLGVANLMMVEHYQSDWGALFAGLVIVMVPVLVVYWAFRDRIHETMIAGALKG